MKMQPNADGEPFKPYSDALISRLRGDAISRREAVRRALLGAGGLLLGHHLSLRALAAAPSAQAKAKSVIQIWMWGGPSHLDTFDPKPEAGSDYCGPLDKPIATNVDGIRICELMPLLAKQADKYSIIRSMTHGNNGHETASYMVQTARPPGGRDVYPCIGAVVSLFKGYNADYQRIDPALHCADRTAGAVFRGGLFGVALSTLRHGRRSRQNALRGGRRGERKHFRAAPEGAARVAAPVGHAGACPAGQCGTGRLRPMRKRGLRPDPGRRGQGVRSGAGEERVAGSLRPQHFRAILPGGAAPGRTRRSLRHHQLQWRLGHAQGEFPNHAPQVPEMDKGMSALLQDLADHGLLDKTIVWWGGEFGRTPKVMWEAPWNGGRGHHGEVFSAVVAGGGFKGGQVVGSSDAKGEQVKERPVYPCDLLGSMYELLGIDPDAKLPHPAGFGCPRHALAPPMESSRADRLKEIM